MLSRENDFQNRRYQSVSAMQVKADTFSSGSFLAPNSTSHSHGVRQAVVEKQNISEKESGSHCENRVRTDALREGAQDGRQSEKDEDEEKSRAEVRDSCVKEEEGEDQKEEGGGEYLPEQVFYITAK